MRALLLPIIHYLAVSSSDKFVMPQNMWFAYILVSGYYLSHKRAMLLSWIATVAIAYVQNLQEDP